MPRRRRQLSRQQLARQRDRRDKTWSMLGQIGAHVLTDPKALKGAGMALEALGKAMQRAAEPKTETAATDPPSDELDLSAFVKKGSDV